MKHRIITVLGIVGAILVGSVLTAEAQGNYPAKTITIIVPEVPGSAADLLSRIIGKKLGEALGQPVNYENLFLEAGVEKATGA
jgi:tripartite-type tricarboxylate transporter receptor subunit TctC